MRGGRVERKVGFSAMTQKSTLKPVRQIAAHELVLDQMRRSMESGQFRPGDRLPAERDMAEQLSVSRTTVRTAISILEREGLITVRRGRRGGFIVQAPDYDTDAHRDAMRRNRQAIRDAFDFRTIVESAAAELAAQRRTRSDITALRRLLGEMEGALRTSLDDQTAHHVAQFQALDSAFHLGIAEAARNAQLAAAVADARWNMWIPVGSLFGRLEPNANDQHEEILAAIEAKDSAGAMARMTEHIAGTRRTMEAWLKR